MIDFINEISNIAELINKENSGMYPGKFKDKGTFEAIISKKDYYDTEYEYVINIYVSLQKCHVFHDGNKRTSLGLLQVLLTTLDMYVIDESKLVTLQILYIENEISKQTFINAINSLVKTE